MGTSRNDRSPLTPPWKMALAIVGAPEIPSARQSLEIWRAVAADRGEKQIRDFTSPVLAAACRDIANRVPLGAALENFDRSALHESNTGLALEIGRRALARCAARKADATGFAGELFAEAVSYYVSRDLPSFVAARGRVATTSEAIRLKETIRQETREQIRELGSPGLSPREWRAYINTVLKTLQGQGGSR